MLGGPEAYKKWFAEGTKEFWEEHWEGLMRQMKENRGVKENILLTTAIHRYESVRLPTPGTVEEVDHFIHSYQRATEGVWSGAW